MKKPTYRRTTTGDKQRLKRLARRQRTRKFREDQIILLEKSGAAAEENECAENGDIVVIRDCLYGRTLTNKRTGLYVQLAIGQIVQFHHVSQKLRRLVGEPATDQATFDWMDDGEGMYFPRSRRFVPLSALPAHTHMTLVPTYDTKRQPIPLREKRTKFRPRKAAATAPSWADSGFDPYRYQGSF